MLRAVIICVLMGVVSCRRSFPPGFKFGVATSSYQIEGAWNISYKSPNIWDTYTHTLQRVADNTTGDVACDSYRLWKRDVEMVKELGVHYYRFSISWARLLPSGFSDYISNDGKNYYNNLINELIKNDITPMITLYHWELPQRLQDLGGWTNPYIAEWFEDYAKVIFDLFADRVKLWVTINEPMAVCDVSYNTGGMAPGIIDPEVANYICIKNTMLAHARAWRLYDEKYKPKYNGKVSITNILIWMEPHTPADEEIAELGVQLCTGMYSHAIYSKEGGWPPSIVKVVEERSKKQGYLRSTLPPFTKEEIELVKGTYDFYAMNYYTARTIRKAAPGEEVGDWPFFGAPALEAWMGGRETWEKATSFWFKIFPEGLRRQLYWLKKNYGDMEIMITENGYSDSDRNLHDDKRVKYLKDHLEQVYLSINKDKVNVVGYFAWSLMDNFEWAEGYESKFGIYDVDFNDPERKRTPRLSAKYYAKVIKAHSLDVHVTRDEL